MITHIPGFSHDLISPPKKTSSDGTAGPPGASGTRRPYLVESGRNTPLYTSPKRASNLLTGAT